jgi:cell division protein ZapA (FtsZ GTPase activity inhibitor)
MAKSVSVTIYGQQFTVVTAEAPDRVEAVAGKVDSLMRLISAKGVPDSNRAAILSSMHLADQVETLEARVAELEAELAKAEQAKAKSKPAKEKKISDLLSLLDQELQ